MILLRAAFRRFLSINAALMKKYIVKLTKEEREQLKQISKNGKNSARKIIHARALLKADQGQFGENRTDEEIGKSLDIGIRTVERIRERLVLDGLDAALNRRLPQIVKPTKIDGEKEAHLFALACSQPPAGYAKWTLRLLADHMVRLEYIDGISHEAVRQTLKKTKLNLGYTKNGAFRRNKTPILSAKWKMS